MRLNANQRGIIREIADAGGTGPVKGIREDIPGDLNEDELDLTHLMNEHYVRAEVASGLLYSLTPKGWAEHRRIMASGDGPEGLKELFRI